MEKMASLERLFIAQGMMQGTTASYMAKVIQQEEDVPEANLRQACNEIIAGENDNENDEDDGGPVNLPPSDSLCEVTSGKMEIHHYAPLYTMVRKLFKMVHLWCIILQNKANKTNKA